MRRTHPGFPATIKGKIYLLLLSLLLPILLVQAFYYYNRVQARRSNEYEANLGVARAVAGTFDGFVYSIIEQELAIGINFTFPHAPSVEQMNHILDLNKQKHTAVREFAWLGPNGQIIASGLPSTIGLDLSDRPYFRAIASGKEWFVSDLFLSQAMGQPVFSISRGIRDETGNLAGIVLAVIHPEKLGVLLALKRTEGAELTILDRAGMVVYSYPEVHWTWESRKMLMDSSIVKESLEGREIAGTTAETADKNPRLVAQAPVQSIGWVARASRLEGDVMSPIIINILHSAGLVLLITIAVFSSAIAIARSISSPIMELRDHALTLGGGDLGHRVELKGSVELQDLGSALNEMAEQILGREQALIRSEEKYRELVENANSIILRINLDGTIAFFNEFAQRFFGYSEKEILGRSIIGTIVPEKDSSGRDLSSMVQEYLRYPSPETSHENESMKKNGERVWIAWTNRVLLDFSGKIAGVLLVGNDITERRQAEEKLKAYTARLELANRELQDFTFVSSHHIQEPLRKIQTFSDRLIRRNLESLDEEGKDDLLRIQRSASRMRALILSLLDFFRIADKKRPSSTVELSKLVDDVVKDLKPYLEETGGCVHQEGLPVIEADPTQMRVLFRNLIGNALKFRSSQDPVIKVYSHACADGLCEIRVEDNGTGFDPRYLDKIFMPFQQLEGRKQDNGTGMGLAICRKIVELHNGTITAESEPGKGTTFIITLPSSVD